MTIKWNLNQLMWLDLTEKGWLLIMEHNNEVFKNHPKHQTTVEELKKKADKDGLYPLMGHEVIKIFGGSYLNDYFNMNVKISFGNI